MVTEKGEAEIAATVSRKETSGCVVLDERRARRGRKMSRFARDLKDDEAAAGDDAT